MNKGILGLVMMLLCYQLHSQEVITDTLTFGKFGPLGPFLAKGLIIDDIDQDAIVGATIEVVNSTHATVSDLNGQFELKLAGGFNRIVIKYLGYEDYTLLLSINEDARFTIRLKQSAVQLEQVVITDKAADQNIESVIMGVDRLSIESLEKRSQLFGETDVLRSIQTLSGVTSVGDGASGFNVRGGNTDENLILQDDALIINPTHTLGFFSLFHPDLIESVDLYKGNQPAYYGGRLSSVLNVGLREGNKEKLKVRGGIGMVASRLTLEGPIQKNKSSFIIGGRVSYMDYILNAIKNVDVKNSKTFFYDLTVKADARLTEKTKVGISTFFSGDNFQFSDEVNFEYQTRTGTFYINQLLNDKWNITGQMNIGDYESSLFDIQGSDLSRFTNKVKYLRGSLRSFYELKEGMELIAGAELNNFIVNPGSLTPEDPSSTAIPEFLPDERGAATTPFLQLNWDISENLSVSGAARYTTYNRLGPGTVSFYQDGLFRTDFSTIEERVYRENEKIASFSGWEPRFSLRYSLSESTSIKAGYNRGYQYLNQVSNTVSSTPIDIWKLSDVYATPQTSSNYNLGLFKNFSDNKIESSVEVFYRDQDRIIEFKDFADLLLNDKLERELVDGVGKAYGIEGNFKLTNTSVQLEVNYTFSRSFRRVVATATQLAINNGDWYPSNYDKPHSLNVNFTKNTGRITSLSVNFTYSTGRPITAPVSNFTVDNILNIPIFSERNQFRIPDYHRLDVSYSIGPFGNVINGKEHRIVLSVYNLYSRRNAYSVFFRQRPSRSVAAFRISTLGAIFPSITYNFKF